MADARYVRVSRCLAAPGGRTLRILARRFDAPAVIQVLSGLPDPLGERLTLDANAAAVLGAQLIAAAAVASGRLDECDAELVLRYAQAQVSSQVRAARRAMERSA